MKYVQESGSCRLSNATSAVLKWGALWETRAAVVCVHKVTGSPSDSLEQGSSKITEHVTHPGSGCNADSFCKSAAGLGSASLTCVPVMLRLLTLSMR